MALARPLPVVKSQHSGVTLSMRVGERPNRSSTPPTLADRKRRYSRDIYWYTLQVWNDNRSEIERRSAAETLSVLHGGKVKSVIPEPWKWEDEHEQEHEQEHEPGH